MGKSTAKSVPQKSRWHGLRKHIRHDPDPNTLIWISTHPKAKTFKPEYLALVVSESYWGCGAVMRMGTHNPEVGQHCVAAVGKAAPIPAQIRWVKKLDEHILSFGMEFEVKK